MTKTIFTKAFVSMSIMASALFFVSCDENKNEPGDKVDPYAIKSLVGEHVVELSEDYLYFFDVTVTYNVDGEESKQNIVTDEFRYTFNYNTDFCEIPAKISGAIKATPKNPVPEYDTQKAYKFEYSSAVNMVVTKNNGQADDIPVCYNSNNLQTGGSKLMELLNKGERIVAQFEFNR